MTALQGRADQLVPGAAFAHGLPHLPPAFLTQGIVDGRAPVEAAAFGFAVADEVDEGHNQRTR